MSYTIGIDLLKVVTINITDLLSNFQYLFNII
jgi:hypothetical protein